MDVSEAIRTKRAVRRFQDRPVPDEVIEQILHAGRRAQSSKNDQPWQFVVIRNRATLAQLATCGRYAGHLAGAAFAVVLVSTTEWAFDIGQAAAYLQLAAWELSISSCLASLQQAAQAKAILGVPADQFLEIAISFGYAAEPPPATPRPRGRRSLADVARWEHW